MIQHGEVPTPCLKLVYAMGSHKMPHGPLLSWGNRTHMGDRPCLVQFPARSQDTTNLCTQRPGGWAHMWPSLPSWSFCRKPSLFQSCHHVNKQHHNSIWHQQHQVCCWKWLGLGPQWEAGMGSVWPRGVSFCHLSYSSSSFSWYQ